jgi:hypothetical protein
MGLRLNSYLLVSGRCYANETLLFLRYIDCYGEGPQLKSRLESGILYHRF